MTPVVSIIMGSTSDLPVMEKAAKLLDEMEIPFEMHALSAHRTPAEVEAFAKGAKDRGINYRSGNRCAYQLYTRRYGRPAGYRTDASGNPCCHCRYQRSIKRRNPGSPDACRRRRTTPGQAGRLQGKSEEKDRKSQRRVSSGIF